MEIFKKICYSWKTFNDLKMSYKYAQQREKLSSLKEKLETVSDNTKDVVEVFKEIFRYSPHVRHGHVCIIANFHT